MMLTDLASSTNSSMLHCQLNSKTVYLHFVFRLREREREELEPVGKGGLTIFAYRGALQRVFGG